MIRRVAQRLSGPAKRILDRLWSSTEQPHFVADHRWQVQMLTKLLGRDKALIQAIGGHFNFGKLEAALLQHIGLSSGQFIIEVGCGSGRLASALTKMPDIRYHGTDVVPELLVHARTVSPSHFRFSLVDGLTIPEEDNVADFVVFYSVVTHLMHHETFAYLLEAKRVLKPGGCIVMSFLELADPQHWNTFVTTVAAAQRRERQPLNAFIEVSVIEVWASKLGLVLERMFRAGTPRVALSDPIIMDNGRKVTSFRNLGQSVAVLRKTTESSGT
jgi:SAM-dependent methyltransferase